MSNRTRMTVDEMAAALRATRRCPSGKAPHFSLRSAQAEANRINRSGKPPLDGRMAPTEAYWCHGCRLWHVGRTWR